MRRKEFTKRPLNPAFEISAKLSVEWGWGGDEGEDVAADHAALTEKKIGRYVCR